MKSDIYPLGKITKTHGYNGTVVLVSVQPLDDELEYLKEIFVMIDGLQVPFQIEKFLLLTETSAHLQLEFVNNQDEAHKLVNCETYAAVVPREPEAGLEQWIGLAVHDVKYGKIGIIQKIEDYNGNIVLQVMDGDRETLISLFSELVTKIDYNSKIIYVVMPDGYF